MRLLRRPAPMLAAVVVVALLGGCAEDPAPSSGPEAPSGPETPSGPGSPSDPTSRTDRSQRSASPPTSHESPSPTPSSTPSRTRPARPADPRWVFFTSNHRRYSSGWFPGRHRIMIGFGCTPAPYYSPDPACPDGQGFHHGIDVAIPCGTPLVAGRPARVLPHDALGPAYGENPVLLRVDGMDVVVGHTRRVFVDVGDRLARGDRFARVSDAGAPDGCHLHFEVRRPGGGVSDAVAPGSLLALVSPGTR